MFPQGSSGIFHFMHHLQLLTVNSRTSVHTLNRKWQHSCFRCFLKFLPPFHYLEHIFPSSPMQSQEHTFSLTDSEVGGEMNNRDTHTALLSCVWLSATPWTIHRQAPLSVGFPRQEYWSGFPFPSPGDPPNPGTEPSVFPALQADSLLLSHKGSPIVSSERAF